MKRLLMLAVVALGVPALAAQISIEARFLPEESAVEGTMTVRWASAPSEAWFALLANLGREKNPHLSPYVLDQTYVWGFDPSWTEVERVKWVDAAGEEEVDYELLPAPSTVQTYSLADVLLRVELPDRPGALNIVFRTRFPHVWMGESGRLGDVYTWRFGWHPLPFAGPQGEDWPLVLQAHHYELSLHVPEGWEAVLPGDVKRSEAGSGTVWSTSFPFPVRSVALFVAPQGRLRRAELAFAQLTVEAVALPGHEDKVRALATYVPEILDSYAQRYGPWGYHRVVLVEHPNEVGVAMTADGIVFIPRWYFDRVDLSVEGVLRRLGLYILAHELAHFYWGIGLGVDFDAENWLSEGMSQYLSIRWFEEQFGSTGGNVFVFERSGLGEELVRMLLGFANLREHFTELPYLLNAFDGFDEAVVKPLREVRYAQATGDRLYNKGYLVLRAMAGLVGEEAFDEVLRTACERARGQVFTVEDLRRLLEEKTGNDWAPFFEQWVYGEAWADYAVHGFTREQDEGEHVTRVRLERRGTGWMPVVVRAFGPDGAQAEQIWSAEEASTELELRTPFPVTRVAVDPDHKALDVDRLNNWWPRKYVISMGRRELPLDGYLVETDVEGQGLSVSYLDRFGWMVYPNQLYAGGWVRYSRDWTLSGEFAWAPVNNGTQTPSDFTLWGVFTITRHLWRQPPTGMTGTYWEPSGDLSFTVARLPDWVFSLSYTWQSVLNRVNLGGLSFLTLPEGSWRLVFTHQELWSLFPHAYLVVALQGGLASPNLPTRFLFQLGELWIQPEDRPAPGDRKFVGQVALLLPPWRPAYAVGGLALLTELRPYVYAAAGQVGSSQEAAPAPWYAEVGGAFVARFEALGGFLVLDVTVGLVWPLVPPRELTFFIRLG